MCGIAGVLRFDGRPIDRARLVQMNRALAHRGPDGGGIEIRGPCGLAHRRLSIIDLSDAGRQPMGTKDDQVWLVHNGEVYNYVELKEELAEKGHAFRSRTDTEVVLNAYREWGAQCFSRFNGMWGIGIWDEQAGQLVLSRDRLGIKPLYIHKTAERLVFASEIKAILAYDPSLAEVDRHRVARFLRWGGVNQDSQTFFSGVVSVDPGTTRTFSANSPDGDEKKRTYWGFRPLHVPTVSNPAESTRDVLIDAVKLRFRSDVPVGTCLSGGLDSSSLVAIAGKKLGKAPEAFSALYAVPEYDETRFVNIMTDSLDLVSNVVSPTGDDFTDVVGESIYYQEQPSSAPGIYSQWHVMKMAAPKVKVLLDGQGADELYGGYFGYFRHYMKSLMGRAIRGNLDAFWEIPTARDEILERTGDDVVKEVIKREIRLAKLKSRNFVIRTARESVESIGPLYELGRKFRKLGKEPITTLPPMVSPDLMGLLEGEPTPSVPEYTGDVLQDLLWHALVVTSIPALLHYEDRNSMAFSIEARVPFLDHRVVENAFSYGSEHKIVNGVTKAVLRDAMTGILPTEIKDRKDKKGYPTPLAVWIRESPDWLRSLVLDKSAKERGFFDPKIVEMYVEDHLAKKRDFSWSLFNVISLELWAKRFIDGQFEIEPPPARAVFDETGA